MRAHAVTRSLLPLAAAGFLVPRVAAQGSLTGSDGSYRGALSADGSLHIAGTVTADMPPDGIFKCTTITVDVGATLTFHRNALNTPVYLLATGPIVINGTIDVSGSGTPAAAGPAGAPGGPGGFDGGAAGSGMAPAGAGQGPGGGKGASAANPTPGDAAYGTPAAGGHPNDGAVYGRSLLVPLVGGSGGGGSAAGANGNPGVGGGGGGGALLLASDVSVTIAGVVTARGGGSFATLGRGGSGGAIRIVAPIVAGTGQLSVMGFGNAGGGRIRVDSADRTALGAQSDVTPSMGQYLTLFPAVFPKLHIVRVVYKSAAGNDVSQTIPEGADGPVDITLPLDATPHLQVFLQPRGFTGMVPVDLVTTPDNGDPADHLAMVDASAAGPAVIEVDIPVNTRTHLLAFTK